jgi:O-glycosyl hydrolase
MKHLYQLTIIFFLLVSTNLQAQTVDVRIDPSEVRQSIEGWGTSLCWWANLCGGLDDAKVNQLVDWLVSPTGLNCNLFRYNIGAGDDPAHNHISAGSQMPCFLSGPDAAYDWTADANQVKIMKRIKEVRPDAIFEAFLNSPPWWMTVSGCSSGLTGGVSASTNLKPAYNDRFCQFVTDVCKHFKDAEGITFRTVELFNESKEGWHYRNTQEFCPFDLATQITLVHKLAADLKAAGLSSVVSSSDETNVATSLSVLKGYQSAGILSDVGQWNTHTYSGSSMDRANLSSLTSRLGIRLWMSEKGSGGNGFSGNLGLAQTMMCDLNYLLPRCWIDWQYVGGDQWGTISSGSTEGTYVRNKNYYVRQQVTRFVRQGYSLITTPCEQLLAAVSSHRDSLVLVVLNNSQHIKSYRFDLSAYPSTYNRATVYCTTSSLNCEKQNSIFVRSKTLSYTAPAMSITTFILPVTTGTDTIKTFAADKKYVILPRAAMDMAVTEVDGALKLAPYEAGNPAQQWTLESDGNGAYSLISGNGNAVTSTSSYYLSVAAKSDSRTHQLFKFSPTDNGCYSIVSTSRGSVFDLNGVKTQEGTSIGLYDYGVSDNAHRQWRIMQLPAYEVSYTAPADSDCTGRIINPYVKQNGYSTEVSPYGWSCTRTSGNGTITKDAFGDTGFEYWAAVSSAATFNYCQTVENLTPGYYKLSAGTFANSTVHAVLYAVADHTTTYKRNMHYVSSPDGCCYTTSVDSIYVKTGTLLLGVKSDGMMDSNGRASGNVWCGADDFHLYRLADATGVSSFRGNVETWRAASVLAVEVYDASGRRVSRQWSPAETWCAASVRNKIHVPGIYMVKYIYPSGTVCQKIRIEQQ